MNESKKTIIYFIKVESRLKSTLPSHKLSNCGTVNRRNEKVVEWKPQTGTVWSSRKADGEHSLTETCGREEGMVIHGGVLTLTAYY